MCMIHQPFCSHLIGGLTVCFPFPVFCLFFCVHVRRFETPLSYYIIYTCIIHAMIWSCHSEAKVVWLALVGYELLAWHRVMGFPFLAWLSRFGHGLQ
ncbi:hypothetical protein BDV28DRAFT_51347 [Aspergillus coremiiformis]|uniref:Uncharacterized protein n=1 Tax=Aspergillus coremiiformis TaxID=138285 RepID=A0A5N6ZET9_9EURO|nr:hypothetical protein BDV28DRAFT_51347 [Aspergillus coremiiformis]